MIRISPKRMLARSLYPLVERWAYGTYERYPFGHKPLAPAQMYREIWNKAREKTYPEVDRFEQRHGFAIDPVWFHGLALLTQVVIKSSEICYQHGRLLYTCLRAYVSQRDLESVNVLEVGTARGFSALCMAKALEDASQPGKIITIDVLPHDVPMYWNCIADQHGPLSRGELLSDYVPLLEKYVIFVCGDSRHQMGKIQIPRVHFAFLDGEHTYEAVMGDFGNIVERQHSGDVVFFDDYTAALYPGVVRAVDEICSSYGYSKEVIRAGEHRAYVIAQRA